MANWTPSVVPTTPPPPAAVVAALERAQTLRERLGVERKATDDAATAVTLAEQEAREAMSKQFAAGTAVKPDDRAIDKAKAAHEGALRRSQACELAVADVESELRHAIGHAAGEWAQTAQAEAAAHQADARRALSDLRDALTARASATPEQRWLTDPRALDSGRGPHMRGLGSSPESARWTANRDPVDAGRLPDAIGEIVDPPSPVLTPEPQPLQPIAS